MIYNVSIIVAMLIVSGMRISKDTLNLEFKRNKKNMIVSTDMNLLDTDDTMKKISITRTSDKNIPYLIWISNDITCDQIIWDRVVEVSISEMSDITSGANYVYNEAIEISTNVLYNIAEGIH